MADIEKVIKELHDARRYLEDKEWSDRGASPHIDAINDALELLKEQEAVYPIKDIARNRRCPKCFSILKGKFCHDCGQAVKWE